MSDTTDEKTESRGLMALPDEAQFKRDFTAINRFQQIVRASMVKDHDFGIIPGTQKPTLLKPGAEKIAKLLGLADTYEILHQAEDWDRPFFRYMIKCRLLHIGTGTVISEGLGECNSMESKYRYRWVGERDLPVGVDKSKLVSQERRSKTGGHWRVYRLDNEDIYSQVNTLIKMAKKRALVDAALSAGRLSDIFTQDIEDMGKVPEVEAENLNEPTPPITSGNAPEARKTGMKETALTNPIGGTGGGPALEVPVWVGEADEALEAIMHPKPQKVEKLKVDWTLVAKYAKSMGISGTAIPTALGLSKSDMNLWKGTQEQALDTIQAYAKLQGYTGPSWGQIKV